MTYVECNIVVRVLRLIFLNGIKLKKFFFKLKFRFVTDGLYFSVLLMFFFFLSLNFLFSIEVYPINSIVIVSGQQ